MSHQAISGTKGGVYGSAGVALELGRGGHKLSTCARLVERLRSA